MIFKEAERIARNYEGGRKFNEIPRGISLLNDDHLLMKDYDTLVRSLVKGNFSIPSTLGSIDCTVPGQEKSWGHLWNENTRCRRHGSDFLIPSPLSCHLCHIYLFRNEDWWLFKRLETRACSPIVHRHGERSIKAKVCVFCRALSRTIWMELSSMCRWYWTNDISLKWCRSTMGSEMYIKWHRSTIRWEIFFK